MSDCKTYPADTVDIYGNVWPTIGENIRNGLFGVKVKTGKIKINGAEITSQDVGILYIQGSQFVVDKEILFFFPILCTRGFISLRFSLDQEKNTYFTSLIPIENCSGEIEIFYRED